MARRKPKPIAITDRTSTKKLLKIVTEIMRILSERGGLKQEHISQYEYINWFVKYKYNKDKDYDRSVG